MGARLPWAHGSRKEAAVKVAAGERSSGAARVSTRAAAPYARQTMWLQRVCANMGAVGLNAKRACNDPSPPAFRA